MKKLLKTMKQAKRLRKPHGQKRVQHAIEAKGVTACPSCSSSRAPSISGPFWQSGITMTHSRSPLYWMGATCRDCGHVRLFDPQVLGL